MKDHLNRSSGYIGLLILSLAAPGTVIADSVLAEVACREMAFANAGQQRDGDAWEQFLATDAVFVGADALAVGKRQARAAWKVFLDADPETAPTIRWFPDRIRLDLSAVWAVSEGPYWYRAKPPATHWRVGRFKSLWHRHAEGWLVVMDDGSAAEDAEAPPAIAGSELESIITACP